MNGVMFRNLLDGLNAVGGTEFDRVVRGKGRRSTVCIWGRVPSLLRGR